MSKSPIIEADIGDGEHRRLFLGRDEIRLIEQETGLGVWSLYLAFSNGQVTHQQVERVVRLALIGGGLDPKEALALSQYYCAPPRPLKAAYILAHSVVESCWNGTDEGEAKKSGKKLTTAEIDGALRIIEANFAKAGAPVDLKGMSLAEVIKLHDRVFGEGDKPEAPDEDTFNAIKKAHKK